MASGWHNKLAHVTNWAELRTRVAQELFKRSDVLRHRLGARPGAIRLRDLSSPPGRFFFGNGQATERAAMLRQYLPKEAAEIVREADEICEHRFRLLGYENLDYGKEIDWHLDRVHGKRAPLEPWCRIPFLNFATVGDHKVTWELNRHQHLITLAKASLLTNDEKYARELMAQWRSWIKSNPYPVGINWGSSLEVAFRSLSWIWVDQMLSTNGGQPPVSAPQYADFRAELLPALAFHGRYIERHLSTYFSPNTHLLGEVLALFFLGTLYPQMPRAASWKNEGWKVLLRESGRQVRPDGVYFEQSLYYHVYALDFFLHARSLAAQNGMGIPTEYDEVLLRMLNVVQALAQSGPPEGFGDDDGGRLFNARRNRTEHMTDPLALGAIIFGRDDLDAAELTEESIWLFGEAAVMRLARARKASPRGTRSTAFTRGGIYVLADGDGASADSQRCSMMIDAGPHGEGRCGHGHADALSLRLTMNGERWLVDSGSGVYVSNDPADRNLFRGTRAHNTIRVDGADQAVAGEPFSWSRVPTTKVDDWAIGKTFTYFAGRHNGYARLTDPVTHRRCVLYLNDGIWLVRDVVLGSAEHDLELRWHFASDVSVQEGSAGEFIASRRQAPESSTLRMLVPRPTMPNDTVWKTQVTRGLISPAYGLYEPAPVVCSEIRAQLPAEIATALIAQRGAGPAEDEGSMITRHEASAQVYELHEGNRSHEFFFPRDNRGGSIQAAGNRSLVPPAWNCGPWSANAELLYCRIEEEKLVQLIVVGGNMLECEGQPLLNAQGAYEFFEWRKGDGRIHAEPERVSTTPWFDELTGGSQSSSAVSTTSSYAERH